MAFDRVVVFDRTQPRGQRFRGEAYDEVVAVIQAEAPPGGDSITRVEWEPATQELIIYAKPGGFGDPPEYELNRVQIDVDFTATFAETEPGSKLFRPVLVSGEDMPVGNFVEDPPGSGLYKPVEM
ncbi:hypothetical protein SEA_CAMERICO_26 [Gordonia phage Camerico]|nr:hypothetical protein SEA_CAMERICO_26 [Gordonia phage Camerico]